MSWQSKIIATHPLDAPLAGAVNHLLAEQRAAWRQLAAGTEALAHMETRVLEREGARVIVQANPGRRASVHARVDSKSVAARPCFLCPENMPAEERGVSVGDLVLLPNPFPIVSEHLTIPSREHRPQQLAGREATLLELARALGPRMLAFYNGPRCGASAPDHFHFQGGASKGVPLLDEIDAHGDEVAVFERFGRRGLVLRGEQAGPIALRLGRVLRGLDGEGEPLLNVVAVHRSGVYNAFVFPRAVHRPACYFADEPARISVSPAALEMMGVLVLADIEHLERIDAEVAYAVFDEVCIDEARIAALAREIQ